MLAIDGDGTPLAHELLELRYGKPPLELSLISNLDGVLTLTGLPLSAFELILDAGERSCALHVPSG